MNSIPTGPAPIDGRHYDAVVVGARVAGSATAMLLAQRGADVLVVDRAALGSDTLSTHALMRGAVTQLDRWGLVPELVAAGTPVIKRTTFAYGDERVVVDIRPEGGADGLFAPRRTVLDPILVRAAVAAGADVRHETAVRAINRSADGRPSTIVIDGPDGPARVTTDMLIGADGLRSFVARELEVPVTRLGRFANATVFKYISDFDLPDDEYLWLNQPGRLGGVIPTTGGQFVVFVSVPPSRFKVMRGNLESEFWANLQVLSPEVAAAARRGRQIGPNRSFPGHVGQFRQASGPGWALVGDAGYFKDPGAAHGMSDALRDAELLAEAIIEDDLPAYGRRRDAFSVDLFDALEDIVAMDWTLDELQGRHIRLSKAMSNEQFALRLHRSNDAALAA